MLMLAKREAKETNQDDPLDARTRERMARTACMAQMTITEGPQTSLFAEA